ncbi:yippee zinc-binding/DNA-binding /Mis18, centromere assembly-domain-containing protein [Gilbertella persicaria]|uniref:yippee zinc-binding/DNA-binding /Mis18, centromere assembly-domain-containing protein n=1 Tax=Gilbertella persicaria TaxID=101096 RepID=UPI00221E99CE|nr:yippee zinc-binding/DNA-binding /Mis18, centromere assembly-domain-containing protein [Gilbertella persicaria]KAI8077911.1 yippee zinc-binding/DNA-binding /Mis18, centromere assembly-domain-containing protein [Gilbertella persicaria]
MKRYHPNYLKESVFFSCSTCHSHLVSQNDIISKAFEGMHGPAFLVEKVINMSRGQREDRMLLTGTHTVADISCQICRSVIGWIYIKAPAKNQKYKEGKCIIEKTRVIKECNKLSMSVYIG